jgi:hypothetical protein
MDSKENPYQSPQPIDYATAQGRSEWPFVSGHTRAMWVVSLLAATILLLLGIVVAGVVNLCLWLRILYGTSDQFESAMRVSALIRPVASWISVPLVVVYLATSVAFLMWIHRVHRNLPSLLAGPLRYSPRWAVGYFFIPILNLIRPFQVMREIWRESDPARVAALGKLPDQTRTPSAAIVGWWWASFLSMHIANQAGRPFRDVNLAGPFVTLGVGMACVFIALSAATLTIVLVLRTDARQSRRHAIILELSEADGDLSSGTTGNALLH